MSAPGRGIPAAVIVVESQCSVGGPPGSLEGGGPNRGGREDTTPRLPDVTVAVDCRKEDLASTLTTAVKVYLLSSSCALQLRDLFFVNKIGCQGMSRLRSIRDERGWLVPAAKGRWLARFMMSW